LPTAAFGTSRHFAALQNLSAIDGTKLTYQPIRWMSVIGDKAGIARTLLDVRL
jgi:hypothetical protein